jgi:NADH dehydrogenase
VDLSQLDTAALSATATALVADVEAAAGDSAEIEGWFAGMAALLPVMPVVSGETKFQPVYVGDVADAVMAAIARDDTAGRTYELGGPRAMSMREVLDFVLEHTQRRRWMVAMPPKLVEFQARIGELLPTPPITRDQLILLGRDNLVAEGALTLADLGIAPKAAEAIVPAYLARYRRLLGQPG